MHTTTLRTLPGQLHTGSADAWHLIERRGTWTLRNHQIAPRTFPSLAKLAWSLGGVVPWDQWSPEAQLQIIHLGIRSAF